ncbi:hypothetical protein PYW08_000270 [Mythimna loreyi]|uniref:Uncharacterized protein n=1 Tax=Mythimna loreyi TaxID=667449 RepID=A0ACC2RB16_9NEOP|nr:hypothetical protein PYW08_000270 [Mythimna loreyi]
MPVSHLNYKPGPADQFSACTEESQLELHLQRQLEDDVARIFDESIYSDLEVVCGKLKILTHSCILRARTDKFYHQLHTFLHVNIERNTFDEIYSFISDVYTECNIQHEEKEIIKYLQRNLSVIKPNPAKPNKPKEEGEEPEVFSTPKSVTPYVDNDVQKVIHSSPSTELTKEYYALVPIEGNLLEKELIEQDELSNAFHSIIKGQAEDTSQVKKLQFNKPTSLSLNSSHTSKTVKHSSSCDILNNICLKDKISPKHENNLNTVADKDFKTNQILPLSETTGRSTNKNTTKPNLGTEKSLDPPYSPDSLITDEPSSSSDYLSAAYACSPGVHSSGFQHQVNVENVTSKMENIYTLSDSGLEDTAMLGSVNSHKDVTLTNMSLSESTLHDLIADDASMSAISIPGSLAENNHIQRAKQNGTSSEKDCNGQNTFTELCGKSLKEEKQRQNEEIVILESSSLSSETGSWESVYPPKLIEKEICEKFLLNERRQCLESPNLVQNTPYKSTACFIDASSLVDEEETIKFQTTDNALPSKVKLDILPAPSQPVPCSTIKPDISPVDWSESNDNEDSLEQAEKKDPDSIQKDLSPTIFEMTPITEDSLCTNAFENATQAELESAEPDESHNYVSDKDRSLRVSAVFMSNTPNNSILSLKTYKQYESEDSESNNTIVDSDSFTTKQRKGSNSPPILSGGVSVEDHLPQIGSSHESSPLPKFKLENTPIVTGAYLPQTTDLSQGKPRTSSASAWVVDMSSGPKTDDSNSGNSKASDEVVNEKKNIFSMYIDLGDKSTLKDMPTRLSSSMTKKNSASVENKSTVRNSKTPANTTERTVKENDVSVSIFEKYESLCNDPNISISEIIAIPEKHEVIPEILEDSFAELPPKANQSRVQKSGPKMSSTKELPEQEDASTDEAKDLFVKLSDLDKPVQKTETLISVESRVDVRMTRSIPDWGEQAFSSNSRSIDVITSFHSENALSLNRLFPHLRNEFSRSMPGSLSSRTRSPLRLGNSITLGDADEPGSDMSEISSMQSSNCRSGFGNSTTDSQTSSLIENCTSRLGQDLLRMFLEEIAPDVIVEVSGKRFKAHKCILSSRCQYFAGILSGGWVESLGNVIVLPPFSYNVVYFALCHIYSGLATIPDSVSIVELATIADMLSLEGLKEAIMFTLKAKYCHHFHKPCEVCIVGVLECFPLSSVYGLDDLHHKCLKWITKHFSKVWPTKAFATLPTDLLDKCYQHHIVNLTIENVAETVYGCGIAAASLQNSRWSEGVARMCRRLINVAAHFAARKLTLVYQSIPPLPSEAPHAAKQALDDFLAAAIEWASPEQLVCAYGYLSAIDRDIRTGRPTKPDILLNTHASNWRMQVEGALVRAAPRVVTTQIFKELPSNLRKRLRELGCIKYGAHALPLASPTHQPERKLKTRSVVKNKPATSTVRSVDIAQVRASFVPYTPKPILPVSSVETLKSNGGLRDFKKPFVSPHIPKVRTTKAQEERAKFNKTKKTKSQELVNNKPSAPRTHSFEKTTSRYLEPSHREKKSVVNKHLPKIESSSESSRNSSPIHLRNLRASPAKGRRGEMGRPSMSQDSLATSSRPRTAEPSTDSLSESQTSNRYATYTKQKHTKGSVESIKTAMNVEPAPVSVAENKMKTKIPIYLNQGPKYRSLDNRNSRDQQKWGKLAPKTNVTNNKPNERKVPGSLMNATKSSSAKIVPKVKKEMDTSCKNNMSRSQRSQLSRQQLHYEEKESSSLVESELPRNMSKSQRSPHAHSSRQQPHDRESSSLADLRTHKTHMVKSQLSAHSNKPQPHKDEKETPPPLKEIPVMERSGTFLKDEPTFDDIINLDISQ